MKSKSSAHEIVTMLIGIQMMILGSIFTPLVSSSKNLSRPALDAGSGAFFFLPSAILVMRHNGKDKNFFNSTLISLLRLLMNQWI